ncbi:MAG: DUF3313 family protein [Terriglobales bacterium]
MKTSLILSVGALTLVLVTAAQADQSAGVAQVNDEGLVPIQIKGLDHVYARPGANLSQYNKVMLDPVEVSFSKSWRPDPAGGPITASERQAIRHGLANILREELNRELVASGRYSLVNTVDADVLRVRAEIRDLYINAPDQPRSGATRPYALSLGEMRLVAELRDGPTGALIARVVDYKKDPDAPWLHFTTRVDNVAAARRAAADWARILRRELDAAHGVKE